MKEVIKVGSVSKTFEVIPVGLLVDYFDDKTSAPGTLSEHFRMIESDGMFIVSVESFFVHRTPEIRYRGFTSIEDAYEYLEMHGVTNNDKEEHEDREDSDRETE